MPYRHIAISSTALCMMSALCAMPAAAHQGMQDDASAGLILSLGAGFRHLSAKEPYPYPRLPGVLEAGSALADERGTDLDYAELGLRVNFNPQLESSLRLTHHGGNDSHTEVESLWLQGRTADRNFTARAGRQELPIGFENREHVHARPFGITPMVMRAAVADAWLADGVDTDWNITGGWRMGGGVWHNQGYPGVESGGMNLTTLRLGWRNESWRLEAGYADVDADGRALLTVGEGTHTHSVPGCDRVSADRVCFNGKAKVWNAAARWQPSNGSWWIGGEYWRKKEKGQLDSIFGIPDYKGEVNGGWLDIGYRVNPMFSLIARIEEVRLSNYLNGANAGLIAEQADIASSDDTPRGLSLVAIWQPAPAIRMLGEWHRDNADTDTIVLLRMQVSFDYQVRK